MAFSDTVREAAKVANDAVNETVKKYRNQLATDEDDLTGILAGNLDSRLDGAIGGMEWSCSVVRHRRGVAAEEKLIGADMVIHVKYTSKTQNYSKGVLIQAKRFEPEENLTAKEHKVLVKECNTMLDISPAAFVFDYAKKQMRCGSASRIAGSSSRQLYNLCEWTPYRFFLELFRCPIGDPRLTTARVRDIPALTLVKIRAKELDAERQTRTD